MWSMWSATSPIVTRGILYDFDQVASALAYAAGSGYFAFRSLRASAACRAASGMTNPEERLTMTTPPVLRHVLQDRVGDVPRAGCDGEGAGVAGDDRGLRTRRTAAIVSGETWEMSTSMPSRVISRTTRFPKGDNP
jgi:hypothetical protein